jgi:hypothetical protein
MHRSGIDTETLRGELHRTAALVRTILDQARSDPGRLYMLHLQAKLWAARLTVADPTSPDLLLALVVGARAAAAVFRLASHPGETFELSLGEGEPAKLSGGQDDAASPSLWLDGFRMASVCREREAIEWLIEAPATVLRASSTRADEYAYLYVEALRGFWQSNPKTGELLVEALAATDPDHLVNADPDYVVDLVVPEMDCFLRILGKDEPAFNAALAKALQLHEGYWSKDERKNDFDGFLALGPLAMAAIAHDRDITVKVDSDYMPAWLVTWDWTAAPASPRP